mmetsp:Transcript_10600/g.22212  ORF Transcript_10600/g.22212 Transcript_10600/m.22212 type:complete len:303 (-) Transcript_10600:8-916(-)
MPFLVDCASILASASSPSISLSSIRRSLRTKRGDRTAQTASKRGDQPASRSTAASTTARGGSVRAVVFGRLSSMFFIRESRRDSTWGQTIRSSLDMASGSANTMEPSALRSTSAPLPLPGFKSTPSPNAFPISKTQSLPGAYASCPSPSASTCATAPKSSRRIRDARDLPDPMPPQTPTRRRFLSPPLFSEARPAMSDVPWSGSESGAVAATAGASRRRFRGPIAKAIGGTTQRREEDEARRGPPVADSRVQGATKSIGARPIVTCEDTVDREAEAATEAAAAAAAAAADAAMTRTITSDVN